MAFLHNTRLATGKILRRATEFITPGGYDAVTHSNRRRQHSPITMVEEEHLPELDRKKLIASGRILRRNFSVAGWMVRRHCDYVSNFRFRAKTGDFETDKRLEKLIGRASRADRAHNKGRHNLSQLIRMAEQLRTVENDVGWVKLNDKSIQLIESDRIRNPNGADRRVWHNGVHIDNQGKPLEYSICKRDGAQLVWERNVSTRNMKLHGYFGREDQVRGVSPLTSAFNELQDVYEFHGLTLARAKVQSFFAVAFYRDAVDSLHDFTSDDPDAEAEEEKKPKYEADLGKGPAVFDLDAGDRAEFLESGQPTTQLQAYVNGVLILALKALDLPMSFLDESWTNFFGSKGAWLLYDRACESKRDENIVLLDDWTYWQMVHWIINGDLVLPDGVNLDDMPWEWIPRKVPVFRRIEDVKADILSLQAGLTTPEGICREEDEGSFAENILEISAAIDHAKQNGVKVVWDLAENPELPDDKDSVNPSENPNNQRVKS